MKRSQVEIYSDIEHLTREIIEETLKEKFEKGLIVKYVYCLHDKDKYSIEDEKEGKGKCGEPKNPHWHIFIKFKISREFTEIANWFGIAENMVRKLKCYFYEDACIYATHANAPEKYQYPLCEAIASPGFDYGALVEIKQRAFKKEKSKDKQYQRKMEIANLIDQGVINQFNLSDHITVEEELIYNSAIQIALDRRRRYLESLNERDLTCIYICGASGASKSSLAVMICEKLGYTYKILNGGSKDPFQPYKGQKAIILNDIDFSTFGWKEFLNLADNHNASLAKARYRDIALVCNLLIITTSKEPHELVASVAGAEAEDKRQFYRRFSLFYKMDYNTIKEFHFNPDESVFKYELVQEIDNIALPVMKEKLRRKTERSTIKIDLVDTITTYAEKNNIIILNTTKPDRHKCREDEPLSELDKKIRDYVDPPLEEPTKEEIDLLQVLGWPD